MEETNRAGRNKVLLIEHGVVVTRLAASPAPTAPTPTAHRGNLKKIAGPEAYGSSREGLRRFKYQLRLVLADEERFANEQHRLRYCFELLKGKPWSHPSPQTATSGLHEQPPPNAPPSQPTIQYLHQHNHKTRPNAF